MATPRPSYWLFNAAIVVVGNRSTVGSFAFGWRQPKFPSPPSSLFSLLQLMAVSERKRHKVFEHHFVVAVRLHELRANHGKLEPLFHNARRDAELAAMVALPCPRRPAS